MSEPTPEGCGCESYPHTCHPTRALERSSDEAVERSELLELLELGGDYAADAFNDFRDKTSECALRIKADIERFNKARAAIAAMLEQSK